MTRGKLSKSEARRSEAPGIMRYVLVLLTAAAFTALVVVFLVVL